MWLRSKMRKEKEKNAYNTYRYQLWPRNRFGGKGDHGQFELAKSLRKLSCVTINVRSTFAVSRGVAIGAFPDLSANGIWFLRRSFSLASDFRLC